MPGDKYLDSIINYWRVYAGINLRSADKCEVFLSQVIVGSNRRKMLCNLIITLLSAVLSIVFQSMGEIEI